MADVKTLGRGLWVSGSNYLPSRIWNSGLRLRDRHAAFDDAKAQGYAGFPALLLDDDRVILDESKLKEIF